MRLTITGGTDELRARIADAQAQLPALIEEAMQEVGLSVVDALSAAAPRGANSGGTPLASDAAGPLADSFFVQDEGAVGDPGAAISVQTSQPAKLDLVLNGRGEVRPVTARALWWQGLQHPVMRSGPVAPNDFASPVIDSIDAEAELQTLSDEFAAILEGV